MTMVLAGAGAVIGQGVGQHMHAEGVVRVHPQGVPAVWKGVHTGCPAQHWTAGGHHVHPRLKLGRGLELAQVVVIPAQMHVCTWVYSFRICAQRPLATVVLPGYHDCPAAAVHQSRLERAASTITGAAALNRGQS